MYIFFIVLKIFFIIYIILHKSYGFKLDIKHILNRDEIKLVIPSLPNVFIAICYGTDQECRNLTFKWTVTIDYKQTLRDIRTLGNHKRLLYIPVNSFNYGQTFEILLTACKILHGFLIRKDNSAKFVSDENNVKMQLFVQDKELYFGQLNNDNYIENVGSLIRDGNSYSVYNELSRIIDDISNIKQLSNSYYMLDVAYHIIQKSVIDSFQFFPENISCSKIIRIISKITDVNTPLNILLSGQEVILKRACNNIYKNLTEDVWKFVDVNIVALKSEMGRILPNVNEFSVRLRRNYLRKFVTNLNNIIVKLQKVHKHKSKKIDDGGTAIQSLCTCYFKSNYSNTCCNVTIASTSRTNLTVLQMNYDPKFVLNKLQDPVILTYVDSMVQNRNEPFLLKFKLDKKPISIHNFSIFVPNSNRTNKFLYKFFMEKPGNVLFAHFVNKNMFNLICKIIVKQSYPSSQDFNMQPHHVVPTGKSNLLLNLNETTGSDVWYFGIVILNEEQTKTVEVNKEDILQIQLFVPVCERWDSFLNSWSLGKNKVNGMNITNDEITVSCVYPNTNYTTEYYTSEIKQPRFWFFQDDLSKIVPKILVKSFCFIIPITVGIIFVIYLILLSVVYGNKKIKIKKDINVLYDNNLNNTYHYLMIVYTGFYAEAGTTANICFKLFGTSRDTPCHVFSGKYQPILQRGSEDWFILLTDTYLGCVKQIQIWTDCYGIYPSWYCQRILLYDLNRRQRWIFNINRWLSVEKCYLIHTEQPYVHGQCFQISQGDSFLEQVNRKHSLLGFLNRPTCYGLSIVTLGILTIMFSLLLFINGFPTFTIRDYIGLCFYEFKFIYLFYVLASALLALFVTSLFSLAFRKRRAKFTTCRQYFTRNWIRTFCMTFMVILIIFLTIILIICGLAVNYYSSLMWLTLSFISVLLYFFIDTLRIWLIVYFFANIEFYTYEELLMKMDTTAIDCDKMSLLKKYGETGMRPLFKKLYNTVMNERKICIKREVAIYANKLKKYITSSVYYIVFYILLLVFVYMQRDDLSYYNYRFVKSLLLQKSYNAFRSIPSSILQLVESFSENIAHDKHHLYANEPFLRQIRISDEKNCDAANQNDFTKTCLFQDFNRMTDRRNYGEGWKMSSDISENLSSDDINAMWLYKTDNTGAPTVPRYEYLTRYPDGGYYARIGNTTNSTKSIVQYLKAKKWLDALTKAAFIEINLYNPNSQFFINGLVIAESSSTGTSVVVSTVIHSFKVHCKRNVSILFVIYIIFTIATILFGIGLIKKMGRQKMCFCSAYNILDLAIVIGSLVLICLFFVFCILQKSYWNNYISDRKLPSSKKIAFNNDIFFSVAAMVVFVSTVRLMKLVTFGDALHVHHLTLKLARKNLFMSIILLVLLVSMFSFWGHVAFGSYSQHFETVKKSFMTLLCLHFRASFTKYITERDLDQVFFFTNRLLFLFVAFAKIIIMAVIIAMLLRAHQKARIIIKNINKCCKHIRFGFLKYMMIRYKVWKSKLKGRAVYYKLRAGQDEQIYEEFIERTETLDNLIGKSPTRLYLVQAVSLQVLEILLEYSLSKNIKCNYKECVARILESLAICVYCELSYCVKKCRCNRIKPENPTCDIVQILCYLWKSKCCGCTVCPYYQNFYNRNRLVVIHWNKLLEKCLGCKKRIKWKRRTWCPKRICPKRLYCVPNMLQSDCAHPPCGKI